MTTYRVGDEGAVVFDEKGNPVATLRSGYVVVPGSLKTSGSLADQHAKRVRHYADKMVRPAEDKARHALRSAISRLDRAAARIGDARLRIGRL